MLFTQFNLEDAKKIWQEEAYEDGEEAGIRQGEKFTLLKQIQRKLQKGKTEEQIAEELEEPLESIIQICATIEKQGLDADVRVIYDCLYAAQFPEEYL